MMRRIALVCAVAMGALYAGGCDEEQLRVLKPRIDLCPTAEASATEEECGETIDLGRIVVGVPTEVQVFIANRGDGALSVTGTTLDVDTIVGGAAPERVAAGGAEAMPMTITLAASALGPGSATFTVTSNDESTPSATVTLVWEGIEPPRGDVLLCDAALAEPICASEIDVDFGAVRPTQTTSRLIVVTNGGETDLFVEDLRIDPFDADFALASSSQSVVLAPGEEGSVVVVFTGNGDGVREANLVVISDDPDTPNAIAHLSGLVGDNLPPTAVAFESTGGPGTTTATAQVSQLVGVDGTTSSDPEGDPLAFTWTLSAPAGSTAAIDDANAQNALFVPDVRGTYTVTLVVADSIDQESAPVSVTIDVVAEFKARARVTWPSGGDVDMHLMQGGGTLFSAVDARYDNRVVGDAELLDDATTSPGFEEAVLTPPVPGAGTWEVWAHVFDDGGLGAVNATVSVVVDDQAPAALELTQSLNATCAAWHAADLVVDAAGNVTVTAVNAPVVTICP